VAFGNKTYKQSLKKLELQKEQLQQSNITANTYVMPWLPAFNSFFKLAELAKTHSNKMPKN
jgi:hypothetical protein